MPSHITTHCLQVSKALVHLIIPHQSLSYYLNGYKTTCFSNTYFYLLAIEHVAILKVMSLLFLGQILLKELNLKYNVHVYATAPLNIRFLPCQFNVYLLLWNLVFRSSFRINCYIGYVYFLDTCFKF